MEVPDLISKEVWEKAGKAFANEENWVVYNNTLLFVHETDIQFFTNLEDAADYADRETGEFDDFHVERIGSLEDFKAKVESVMAGLVYKPVQELAMVAEEKPSFFPKNELLNKQTIIMTEEKTASNLDYLKNQLLFLGFGDRLNDELEKKMKEGKPEFNLTDTKTFGKDNMEAVIHFRHSVKDGKEAYFCNHYISTLKREGDERSQFIYVNNKGQSITFKESCNLLNSRSVFKEITPREGSPYKAWLKIDHENMDPKIGYPKLRQFTANYGFDLKEAIKRVEFKGMKYDDQLKGLMKSLQKGNFTDAITVRDGRETQVSIEANPERRTLNMYDAKGEKMFYPMKPVEQKYGQAPSDAKRKETSMVNEPVVKYEKKNLLKKDKPSNGLLQKRTPAKKTGRGNKIK